MKQDKAIIITIGDELLMGQTIDTNSAWMAKQLQACGIAVIQRVAVGDDARMIREALDDAIPNCGLVLITGGLGPTADDITKPLLCEYFGGKLVIDETVLQMVSTIFEKRNLPLLERNRAQAAVPDTCKVLLNHRGTAPGMQFEKEGTTIIAMPGVPYEMMGMMEDAILPQLKQKNTHTTILHKHIVTIGMGESFLADKIADIEHELPSHIKLAYLPHFRIVKLRLTGTSQDAAALEEEIGQYQQRLAERLQEVVIALEDLPLEQLVKNVFMTQQKTLALAESCTGGYIGHTLTQSSGASEYFQGGIICYTNQVKASVLGIPDTLLETQGPVSEAVALQMALQVRQLLKSDYGLGITGWLSPSPQQAPSETGTVWIAVSDGKHTIAQKFHFHYDRIRNKEIAVQMALSLLLKHINGKES